MFNKNKIDYTLDEYGANNIRGLCIDMINKANSGHPGICLGAANIIYTLFKRHMNISLDNLDFVNRDRFILSAGHGAPLLYAVLYMMDLLSLDDLKNLRQLHSKTPGHPEYGVTPLVEMSTGPLGQGIASSVGFSISEAYLKEKTNGLIDHYTYVLCGDGELEEGITYEALALAGRLKLNKLIVLYDSNDVTLDSNLDVTSNENIHKRFESIGFKILETNDSCEGIDEAIKEAKESSLPTIIICKTIIGKYSLNAAKNIVHGKPLDEDDILSIKQKLDLHETLFTVSSEVVEDFRETIKLRGNIYYNEWLNKYEKTNDKEIINRLINKEVTYSLDELDISYDNKSLRDLSGEILNHIATNFPLLIGGSADLSSSCKTNLIEEGIFGDNNYKGRNIYFGIREHAMGAIINGMALNGLRPFGSTFLVFSDYLRPAIRMSALMNIPSLYIFTHDSISVGEDGGTHHPIEQLATLELIPNLKVYRPFDLNELIGAYQDIFENHKPSVLVLPRDNREISHVTSSKEIKNGIYIVRNAKKEDFITIIANGEELGIALKVANNLEEKGIDVEVISIPCIKNITKKQKEKLLKNKKIIGLTLGIKNYLYEYTNEVIGIEEFSLSAKKDELLNYFGLDIESIENKIIKIIEG